MKALAYLLGGPCGGDLVEVTLPAPAVVMVAVPTQAHVDQPAELAEPPVGALPDVVTYERVQDVVLAYRWVEA